MTYNPMAVTETLLEVDHLVTEARKEIKKMMYVPAHVRKNGAAVLKWG
jgi:hypothetical protein